MFNIYDYILQSQEERQKHLDLLSPCVERGGTSTHCVGLLAEMLDTSIPKGKKIHLCHACHNGKCSNWRHLYWGTASENSVDRVSNTGTIWEAMVNKYGEDGAREVQRRSHSHMTKMGKAGGSKPKSDAHKAALSEASRKSWEARRKNKYPADV